MGPARRDSPRYKTVRRDSPGYINSPKSSPSSSSPMQRLISPTLKFLLDLDSRESPGNNSSNHRARANSSEHDEILSLISYCSYVYTFTDPSESPLQQNLKSEKLTKLLSIIRSPPLKTQLNGEILSPLFSMISANLFRPLPPPPQTSATSSAAAAIISPDDEDLAANPTPAWPHLQIVHDILLRLIASVEPKALRKHVDGSFVLNLLALFGSEDPRERECVKSAYHKIYSKLHHSRSFMRKAMNGVFLDYIFEAAEQRHCGIGDLLEIWGTIINGFSVPLRDEHKLFLTRVLVPLHRPKGMQAYHKQLAYCVYQFVEKEPMLGVSVVGGILRHWPVTNCHKEVLLIGELEELVDSMGPEQYKILALPLCKRITKCLNSWNSQVAERALYVWNNEQFVKMASEAIEDVFPVLVEGMERNLRWHWSRSVRQLTQNVKEMLEEMEPTLYSTCLSQLRLDDSDDEREIRRKEMWERVEMAANANSVERSVMGEDRSFLAMRTICS